MAAWSLNWLTTAKPATVSVLATGDEQHRTGRTIRNVFGMGRENSKLATSIVTVSWGWRPYQLVRE